MSKLPAFVHSGTGLPATQAFDAWRNVMARMFAIERTPAVDGLPRGGLSAFLIGDIMGNRSLFSAQRLSRDRRRIEATPDHLVLQLYRSGGFSGDMGGRAVQIARGQIAVCDLRRPLDVRAVASDTVGLTVPRHLLAGTDLDRLAPRLDPARERLLAAHMRMLHHRLPTIAPAEAPGATADLIAVLRRLFDPSSAADVLEGRELDADLLMLAEQAIVGGLAAPDLSPALIAERLGVSRSTLYRVFAPLGGVMQHVWTMRLDAVRAALDQVVEPRTLARLAADHGFKSSAHLSRAFRARYGIAPRDRRAESAVAARDEARTDVRRLNALWHDLGR